MFITNQIRLNDKVFKSLSEEKFEEYVSKTENQENFSKEEVQKMLSDMGNEIISEVNKELKNNTRGIVNNTGLATQYFTKQQLLDFIRINQRLSLTQLQKNLRMNLM